ncbi:MAG: hypothetical protein IT454_10440 [Planctomycetes bacterium]|nr:hypothetical protein [Planctomycetota bacterium]
MSPRLSLFTSAVFAAAFFAQSASAQCVTGGAGGAFPASGAVDGTWPTIMPTGELVSTLSVTVPPGATVLNSVKLNGLSHTWIGDMHVVLEDPAGGLHNIFQNNNNVYGGGCSDQALGDYEFVDPLTVGCGGNPAFTCGLLTTPPGILGQEFGTWPSGSSGINNTPIEQIPISSGTWTLHVYDWFVPADAGTLTSWDLCFGQPSSPPTGGGPTTVCVSGGAGGSYPASGAVDGTWPTTMPTGQLSSALAVTLPPGSTKIKEVKINGLSHTWLGDTQIVLETPSGQKVNLFQQVDGVFGGGCADAFGGDYVFVDELVGTGPCNTPAAVFSCGNGTMPPGYYHQFYGAWPTGSSSIDNVGLESVAVASGTYTLHLYDWYVIVDGGSITSWEICFDGASGPVSYCTAGTSTNGCSPAISATAQPSATLANPCMLNVAGVDGQKNSLVFYGVNNAGFTPISWGLGSTSLLCVKSPTQRMNSQNTGGTSGQCNGSLTQDWNAYQTFNPNALGAPFSAGQKIYAQAWYRDPAAVKTTNLSDALELTMAP